MLLVENTNWPVLDRVCVCVYIFHSPCRRLPELLSVTLWFCYFQLKTGCDSDCMVDCVIEWTNHTHRHMCMSVCALHSLTHRNACTHTFSAITNTEISHTHRYTALCTHTLRASGNGAGFPLFKEAPEGEWADDGAPPAVHRGTLLSFNIGLKHQLLTWLTTRSEKRIERSHALCALWKQKDGWKWGKTLRSASETGNKCQFLPQTCADGSLQNKTYRKVQEKLERYLTKVEISKNE